MKILRLVLLLPWLTACGHDSGYKLTDFNFPETTEVQFVNLMPDSPSILATVADATTSNIAGGAQVQFGQGSSQSSVVIGDYDLSVSYTDADGNQQYLIDKQPETYTDQDQFVYLFMGPIGSPIEQTARFVDPFFTGGVPAGSVEVWFADGASLPDTVDIYLTSANTPIAATSPSATLASFNHSDPITVNNRADWRLRVTPHDSTTILFDSGTFQLLDKSRNLFAVTDYFGPKPTGTTLVNAVLINGGGTFPFTQGTLPSRLRVINLIRDLPPVDVYFGSTAGTPMFDNVVQLGTTAYQDLTAGSYALNVTEHGIKDQFVLEQDLTFGSGTYFTLILTGSSADSTLDSVIYSTDPRPIIDRTKVNFINAATVNGKVNLYLLDPGQAIGNDTPQVSNALPNALNTVTWHSGELDLVVTSADNQNVIVGPERVVMDAGKSYTLVLVEDPVGYATSAKLLILEDTAG